MRRRLRLLHLLAAAVAVASCSSAAGVTVADAPTGDGTGTTAPSSAPGTTGPPSTAGPAAAGISWRSCGNRLECGTMAVPLDHADPSKGTITLALRRHLAAGSKRVGSLVMNPGGPGVPALEYADAAPELFPNLVDRFDIVSWDPRGVGESTAVACTDDIDQYLAMDPTPDTPAEDKALLDAAKQYAAQCQARSGRILPYVGTADTARDLDLIRAALGEQKLTFIGFSYGSELGATYATLFPDHVRAIVLDGASDANASYEDDTIQQVRGLERVLDQVLDDCSKDRSCPFWNGGDAGKAFDALMASLDTKPLAAPAGRPPIGQGIAYIAVVSALYDSSLWSDLTAALAAAAKGDGRGLLSLYDRYTNHGDPAWAHTFDALSAVNCLDDPGPLDESFPDRFAAQLAAIAPRLGAASAYNYTCIEWPARAPKLRLTAKGTSGPILVVGTTGDPITPLESSQHLAADLDRATLLTVDADGHTGYSRNACSRRTVDAFLLDLTVPPAGTVCR